MTAYISARFEKDSFTPPDTTVRVITRNLDQGAVPPAPSATYFPTHEDVYQTFIVAEYENDTVGERFVKAADLSELTSLFYSPMDVFHDPTAGLGAVNVNDILEITNVANFSDRWVSDEYPGAVLTALVAKVDIDASHIELRTALPAFQTGLVWNIADAAGNIITQGITGATRRSVRDADGNRTGIITTGGGPIQFLEKRFNSFFPNPLEAENFVIATKAEMTALSNEVMNNTVVDEDFTAEPTT